MAIGAAIAGGIASAAAGAIINKATSKKSKGGRGSPKGFTSPGATISSGRDGVFGLERGIPVSDALSGITNLNTETAGGLGGLLADVKPGFGRLTKSRLDAISSARERAIGNLRDNLSRRRVMGSSFAQDALTRAELEFSKEEERARSESFLQELDMTRQLIQERSSALLSSFATALEQSNFESTLAANYANGTNAILSQNAALMAQIQADNAAGLGKFFEPVVSQIGSGVSNWYSSNYGSQPASQPAYYSPSQINNYGY